jgi:hypothetical protein
MNKNNQTKLFIGLGLLIVVSLIGLFLIINGKDAKPTDTAVSPSPSPIVTPNDRPSDDHDGATSDTEVNTSFSSTYIVDATEVNTSPKVIAANTNVLLMMRTNRTLYVYDHAEKTRTIMTKNVTAATLSKDGKHVFYAKEEEFGDTIYDYNLELKSPPEELFTPKGMSVKTITADNGAIVYTMHPFADETKLSTGVYILKENTLNFPAKASGFVYNQSADALSVFDHTFYTYNPVNKSISALQLGIDMISRIDAPGIKGFAQSLSVYDLNHWSVIDNDLEGEGALRLQGSFGRLEGDAYTLVVQQEWFSDHEIIFLNENTLYLLNTSNMEVSLISENVGTFAIIDNTSLAICDGVDITILTKNKN